MGVYLLMADAVIETKALTKEFSGKPAVRDLSLAVQPGSIYAFLGPNGAGKSTTIRLLLGLLRPSRGDISLFGQSLKHDRREILARTGSLVETPSLYEHLTAKENLEIPRRILGAPLSDIDRVLRIVGLENASRNLVKTFSLGMKQRLGLAHAFLGKRELLILDEPTNGLDPAGIQEMRSLIRQLPAEHGVTVFLSSHLLTEVEQVATHVGMLSQGELVFQGSIEELERLRRARLRIGVNNIDSALTLIRGRGWNAEREDGYIFASEVQLAPAINQALVEAGLAVHHLTVETASLEEVFLTMTQ
ncbi:MAG TPA: ATP-binding cassette domain-containing protein, partial [Pyrinomonadaceae bacterium]|nr:ATP-binding cassette domain-containing protein [Pyrinomonadaceae bacterium]